MTREAGVLATAVSGPWHVMLGDDYDIQLDGPFGFFNFKLCSYGVVGRLKEYVNRTSTDDMNGELKLGTFGRSEVVFIWDDEFPDSRAFLKIHTGDGNTLSFTLTDFKMVNDVLDQISKDLE